MIRFLQKDSRFVKAFFVVIIGLASVSMVIYLIPGLTGMGASAPDTFAVVYPHWYSRFLGTGETISQDKVSQLAQRQMEQQHYPSNPMIQGLLEQRVGQQLVNQQIVQFEAQKLGIRATDDDVRAFLRKGVWGEMLFPNGQFIGQDKYAQMIGDRLSMSVADFEHEVKGYLLQQRLTTLITAGVGVSDKEVRDAYRKQNLKIKFDYAVLVKDDLAKQIHPSDADLQGYFQKNSARYAQAVPEQRKIAYVAFTAEELPGGVPQASQQEIQQYYNAHKAEYQVPDQARGRHILIKVTPGADAKTDAAAKAKALALQKQIQGGANFVDLAKKNSDDPGSKDQGGELGFAPRGKMVPEFDKALFSQKVGDTAVVKTQFGYHVLQVEERQTAHSEQLNEVLPTIQATLIRQKLSQTEENYAHQLVSEASKKGLQAVAAAHHLHLETTPPVARGGVISTLPNGSDLINKAFAARKSDPPQFASTGEGYAVFQVAEISAAHAPSFADWKEHVDQDYREEQLPILLAQKTQDLANRAKQMNDLGKAAKAVGATVKSSELVGQTDQVPDFGQLGQVAPQLFGMASGSISGPINAGRTGVVVKILDKQEPSADEIAKNYDQTREQMLTERRQQAFEVFMSGVLDDYKKHKRIALNAKNKGQQAPEM